MAEITTDTIKRVSLHDAIEQFKMFIDDKTIFILTFGNAFGKQMARIANMIRTTGLATDKIFQQVFVLSIDPLFKEDAKWNSFVSNLKPTFKNEHMRIEATIDEVYANGRTLKGGFLEFTSTDDDTRANYNGYTGLIGFVDEEIPSQYYKDNLESTEQIIRDRSFAYADRCVPSEDNPANALKPLVEEILKGKGGTVYIDNDAWIQINGHVGRNHKITQYLQNRYMEFYCEVLYILKQFKSPRILFYNGNHSSIRVEMKDFIPLDAMFVPDTFVKKGREVHMNQEPSYSHLNAKGGRRYRTKRRRNSKYRTTRRNSRT